MNGVRIGARHAGLPVEAALARGFDELGGSITRALRAARSERRLRVREVAGATEVVEIVHAAPVAMHVLHFDRSPASTSALSSAAMSSLANRALLELASVAATSRASPRTFNRPIQRPCGVSYARSADAALTTPSSHDFLPEERAIVGRRALGEIGCRFALSVHDESTTTQKPLRTPLDRAGCSCGTAGRRRKSRYRR